MSAQASAPSPEKSVDFFAEVARLALLESFEAVSLRGFENGAIMRAVFVGLDPTAVAVYENSVNRKQLSTCFSEKTQNRFFAPFRQESVQFGQLAKLPKTAQTFRPCRAREC